MTLIQIRDALLVFSASLATWGAWSKTTPVFAAAVAFLAAAEFTAWLARAEEHVAANAQKALITAQDARAVLLALSEKVEEQRQRLEKVDNRTAHLKAGR